MKVNKPPQPKELTLRHIFGGSGPKCGPMLILRLAMNGDEPVNLSLGWLGNGTAQVTEIKRLSRHLRRKGAPLDLIAQFLDQHLLV